jgi:hypothetical protein
MGEVSNVLVEGNPSHRQFHRTQAVEVVGHRLPIDE